MTTNETTLETTIRLNHDHEAHVVITTCQQRPREGDYIVARTLIELPRAGGERRHEDLHQDLQFGGRVSVGGRTLANQVSERRLENVTATTHAAAREAALEAAREALQPLIDALEARQAALEAAGS